MGERLIYLDSSVALQTILDAPGRSRVQTWMSDSAASFVSSRLLRTEVIRVLRRDGRPVSDAAPLLGRIGLVDITREAHTVAESIERHVRTLDALHLATALLLGDGITVATHDRAMAAAAAHLGLEVTDPIG